MQAKLQSNRQRMQAYPGETASAQELKQYIKAYIENRLSTFQMMKNLGILKQL